MSVSSDVNINFCVNLAKKLDHLPESEQGQKGKIIISSFEKKVREIALNFESEQLGNSKSLKKLCEDARQTDVTVTKILEGLVQVLDLASRAASEAEKEKLKGFAKFLSEKGIVLGSGDRTTIRLSLKRLGEEKPGVGTFLKTRFQELVNSIKMYFRVASEATRKKTLNELNEHLKKIDEELARETISVKDLSTGVDRVISVRNDDGRVSSDYAAHCLFLTKALRERFEKDVRLREDFDTKPISKSHEKFLHAISDDLCGRAEYVHSLAQGENRSFKSYEKPTDYIDEEKSARKVGEL